MQVADDLDLKGIWQCGYCNWVNGKIFKSSKWTHCEWFSKIKIQVSDLYRGWINQDRVDGKTIKLSNGKTEPGLAWSTGLNKGDVPVQFISRNWWPSACSDISLAIYQKIPDLRQGRHIIGTGTINQDGTVMIFGGIDRKSFQQDKEEWNFLWS